jgi:hypothetical protein
MSARRIILGVIATAMLLVAGALWLSGRAGIDSALMSVLVRVGIVLLTIFVAWPTLAKLQGRLPAIVTVTLLVAILFVAIRPKLLPIAIALVVAILVVHFGFRIAARQFGAGSDTPQGRPPAR